MKRVARQGRLLVLLAALCAAAVAKPSLATDSAAAGSPSLAKVIDLIQPKIVKIYGAGGLRGLEAYQSGFLISAEGHVLTVWSYVLDTDDVACVLDDGRKFQAKLLRHDPRLEIAVLKIDAEGLPHFRLNEARKLAVGTRVLAFSNLFGVATGNEAASVLHGHVAAETELAARRGAFDSLYRGRVYVLDAMTNNPGAAGGVLTDWQGNLAAVLGKELRNSLSNTWLNYAIPIDQLAGSVDDILAGRTPSLREGNQARKKPAVPMTLEVLGLVLVPDVLPKTPPFIDDIRAGSPAAVAGLKADDFILFVNDEMAQSCAKVVDELAYIDRIDRVKLVVQRGQQLLEVELYVPR